MDISIIIIIMKIFPWSEPNRYKIPLLVVKSIWLLTGGENIKVENNKIVSFHYTLTLKSGDTIDSSAGRESLSIIVGAQQIIPGLEKELVGLKEGDKKEIMVQPEQGYGNKKDELVHVILHTGTREGFFLPLHYYRGHYIF